VELGFSVDLHDHEGDIFEECILIYIEDRTIIKFSSYAEVVDFSSRLNNVLPELKENLPIERQSVELATTAPNSAMVEIGERLSKYNSEFDKGNITKDDFVERVSQIAQQLRQ
jgi:hypothetical protein